MGLLEPLFIMKKFSILFIILSVFTCSCELDLGGEGENAGGNNETMVCMHNNQLTTHSADTVNKGNYADEYIVTNPDRTTTVKSGGCIEGSVEYSEEEEYLDEEILPE